MAFASNTTPSRPVQKNVEVHKYLGGLAWNDEVGLFFPTEGDLPPFRRPHFASYRPTVRD